MRRLRAGSLAEQSTGTLSDGGEPESEGAFLTNLELEMAGHGVSRSALRGVGALDATSEGSGAEPAWVAKVTDGLRYAPKEAFDELKGTVAANHAAEHPFAHPAYWACTVVYGA
jgi:hypothetical protein